MTYLYIFEDGEAYQSEDKPTEEDYKSIENGILQVLKYKDGYFYDMYESGRVALIPFCKSDSTFHSPENP